VATWINLSFGLLGIDPVNAGAESMTPTLRDKIKDVFLKRCFESWLYSDEIRDIGKRKEYIDVIAEDLISLIRGIVPEEVDDTYGVKDFCDGFNDCRAQSIKNLEDA